MASKVNSVNVGAESNVTSVTQHNTNHTNGGAVINGPMTISGGIKNAHFGKNTKLRYIAHKHMTI